MRLLYLDWPHLPLLIERQRVALPELVVIGGQPWEQDCVLDCSPAAADLGVRRGQPLGVAHRLAPEAHFLAADRPAYEAAMKRALDTLANFSPSLEGEAGCDGPHFGRVLIGIEGLHRLWGDEATLCRRALAAVAQLLPGEPRAGIGNTRFGAHLAAVVGARRGVAPEVIPAGEASAEAAYLAPLPIGLLPADEETQQRLRVLGFSRLGQFAALSRSAVVARFGQRGGELHDLARGLDSRPLRLRRPLERLRAEAEIEPPVDEIEPLRFVLRHLSTALCAQLAARGAGAGRALLELELDHAPPQRLEQALPEPTAAAGLIERLLLARLTAQPPPAAVNRLALELTGSGPVAGQQLGLFSPQLARAARLDWQLAGLAIRFGPDRLLRAQIADPEASLSEQRVAWQRVTEVPLRPR